MQVKTISATDALPDVQAREVHILNNSGDLLTVNYAGYSGTNTLELKDGQSVALEVQRKANELEIDGAGTNNVSIIWQ